MYVNGLCHYFEHVKYTPGGAAIKFVDPCVRTANWTKVFFSKDVIGGALYGDYLCIFFFKI